MLFALIREFKMNLDLENRHNLVYAFSLRFGVVDKKWLIFFLIHKTTPTVKHYAAAHGLQIKPTKSTEHNLGPVHHFCVVIFLPLKKTPCVSDLSNSLIKQNVAVNMSSRLICP